MELMLTLLLLFAGFVVVIGRIGWLNVIVIMNPSSVGWTVGSSHPLQIRSAAAQLEVHHPPIHHYNENP